MAASETLEILEQIQVLVIDKLQVASYKWISRNFSVSSNHAKRLLRDFLNKHDNSVEVLYSLSGWSKNNSSTYCIKLASGKKLEETMKEFDGDCTVEVYSIQRCLPKDLSVLWNTEFLQAEELFNQPAAAENCLRNNSFSAILNPFVKRTVNGQSAAVSSTSQLKSKAEILQTKAIDTLKEKSLQPQQGKGGQFDVKEGISSTSVNKTDQNVDGHPKTSHSSLATLWDRASVKSKPSCTTKAQICAKDAAEAAASSDDESFGLSYKRESRSSCPRKRQYVIDYSEEEDEDDNAVSLASPIPPNEMTFSDSLLSSEKNNTDKELHNTDKSKSKTSTNKEDNSEKVNENNSENEIAGTNKEGGAPMSSKRKKVVKTRIDERGREGLRKPLEKEEKKRRDGLLTVVWEDSAITENVTATPNDVENRSTNKIIKEQATVTNAAANTATRGGTKKPAKGGSGGGGVKDSKQGNILSFFKKI